MGSKAAGPKMERAFFQGESKKAAPSAPTGSAAEKLIELLETAPELAQPLLHLIRYDKFRKLKRG